MKSIVDAKEFSMALKRVMGAAKRSRIPQLEQVEVTFAETSCKLTATDLNVWLAAEIPAQGDTFSVVFSNTKAVERACRFFDGDLTLDLSIEGEDRKLCLSCGGKSGVFPVWKDEDYHELPTDEARWCYPVNAAKLHERVKKVSYAALSGAQRAEFGGVRFEDHHVWCVDGTRMAVSDDDSMNVVFRFIASLDAVNKLSVFGDTDITIEVGVHYISFVGNGTILMTRHIDASDSLKVENILQMKGDQQTRTVDRGEYLRAIKYLDGCSQGMSRRYVMCEDGQLSLETGAVSYRAEMESERKCAYPYSFDLVHMKEALTQFSGQDIVQISVGPYPSPIVLSTESRKDMALLLPVRMKNMTRQQAA